MVVQRKSHAEKFDQLYIGGKWVHPESGRQIETIDPSTGKVWATTAEAAEKDIDNAVQAAKKAFRSGPWPELPSNERGKLLYRLTEEIYKNRDELAELEAIDSGMLLTDAYGDVDRMINWITYNAGAADKIHGDVIPANPNWHSFTSREPVGVVGIITPWNTPLLMYAQRIAPALAAGCTVVLKPSELTPVTALVLARIMDSVGVPPGVFNVVPGYGDVAGEALVGHPDVAKISFTGSTAIAQHLMSRCSTSLKRFAAEAGGKAPQIVCADSELSKAFAVAADGAFRRCGQSCALASRILVEDKIYDQFIEAIVKRAEAIRIGSPLDAGTELGPQASTEQLEKTQKYIELGKAEGASLLYGGGRPDSPDMTGGYFIEPTVFGDVANDMSIAQDEIFGPVASVIRFSGEEDLVEKANGVAYGLTASMWTMDVKRAHRVARKIEAGSVWVNVYPAIHWSLPYGGYKMSGIGRDNGMDGILQFTELKTIVINMGD